MSKEVTAKECALHEVFSPMYEFKIPPYQRPYAWTTEESGQLVEDLYVVLINGRKMLFQNVKMIY